MAPVCGQAPKVPPLPDGPLLKRAPDFSTWSITIQGPPPAKLTASSPGDAKSDDGKGKPKLVAKGHVNTTKIGTTILVDNVDAQGRRSEVWHFGTIRVLKQPDGSAPIVSPDVGGGDIYSVDFTTSDFAGFDWLSAKTYTGITKYEGRDCIEFKGSVSPLEASARNAEASAIGQSKASGPAVVGGEMKVPAVAYIDLETRLPVFVSFGDEQRIYEFGTPSTTTFALPPDVVVSLKAYAAKIKRLSAPAGSAF